MNTDRFVIADRVWEKVAPHLPGKATDCGVTAAPLLWPIIAPLITSIRFRRKPA